MSVFRPAPIPELYGYWRSSASYRVRIALSLKQQPYRSQPVNLLSASHRDTTYAEVNPQQLVPCLRLPDGRVLTQSLAIIDYLDETIPNPPLLPNNPVDRAHVRALAQVIACDTHPITNLRVLKYLTGDLAQPDEAKTQWLHHWMHQSFQAFESMLQQASSHGQCCFGDDVTLADICLIPQLYNAHRFGVDMGDYPLLTAIESHCLSLPAFQKAIPENQPDAKP